jgi:hypothetical protein
MVFLALLAIAIGVLLAISLVLVGLIEAPWPVLLVGLLAALYGLQRVLVESQALPLSEIELQSKPQSKTSVLPRDPSTSGIGLSQADSQSQEEDMLTYRGIHYRVAKAPEQTSRDHNDETLVEGVYRGQHWQRWRANHSAAESSDQTSDASEITYRGHKVIKPERES